MVECGGLEICMVALCGIICIVVQCCIIESYNL